ncbi:MAG: hypothetical protein ACJAR2_002665 [Ilumatobacter sp.]|jgi:hypothetical protein
MIRVDPLSVWPHSTGLRGPWLVVSLMWWLGFGLGVLG